MDHREILAILPEGGGERITIGPAIERETDMDGQVYVRALLSRDELRRLRDRLTDLL